MAILKEPISRVIWDVKYRYRLNGHVVDDVIEETWLRVAKAIAKAEKPVERAHWQREFNKILEGFQFLPGGRILAGAGTKHKVTLFNCFVMDIAEDSLRGIFDALEEGALTLQQGGGVGYDFSILRPRGDLVRKTGMQASGPISFMKIWDTTCGIMLSTGARRGAMMGVLRCDHPDIEEFVDAKADPSMLRHFNVSVLVTDAFMQAVKNDEDWQLVFPVVHSSPIDEIVYRCWGDALQPIPCKVYRRIRARELWHKIIRSAYDYAEPGVLFGDTINRMNNLWYRERINATNPCGEIPLPSYGACNLGAVNLTQFVRAPFTAQASFDWIRLEQVTAIATRFQDNVIDVSHYPLKKQKEQALGSRRIGLGITGLGDVFVMLGMRYGSPESIAFAQQLMKRVAAVTWQVSIDLAKEKGVFPFYQSEYLRGAFVQTLDQDIQHQLAAHGVRNSHHNTIAPTGTISLFANNISNGIEPIFKAEYDRHVRMEDDELLTFRVKDYAYQMWMEVMGDEGLPEVWADTDVLSPDAHLQVQAAVQPYIDNAISKTINIPCDFPFEKLMDVYSSAYAMGLKGCTVFRPNTVTGSVMEDIKKQGPAVDHCCPNE